MQAQTDAAAGAVGAASGGGSRDTANARTAVAFFAALWSISILFHLGSYSIWLHSLWPGLAALWLLARPTSLGRLLLLCAVVMADAWLHSPLIPNHWLFHGVMGATVWLSFGILALRQRRFDVDPGELYRAFAPVLRMGVILLYFYAVLHKLNWDFLLSDLSCGAEFYRAQRTVFPFLPEGRLGELATAYGTLLAEAAIPILLAPRATRRLGVLLGVVFHVLVSFNPISGFFNFSALIFALFFVFTPEGFAGRLQAAVRDSFLPRMVDATRSFSPARLALFGLAGLGAAFALVYGMHYASSRAVFTVLWLPYAAAGVAAAAACVHWWPGLERDIDRGAAPYRLAHPVLAVVPLLLFVNGMTPYLGLKSENAFAMFSNLRTEGGETNHLFIPVATQVFGFQRDLVEVVDSSDPGLKRLGDDGLLIPYFELRRILAGAPESAVVYRRGTEKVSLTQASQDASLVTAPSYLQRKTMRFRMVQKAGETACRH